MFIPNPDFFPSWIPDPDPGVKKKHLIPDQDPQGDKKQHINYRDSKLIRIQQNSLGWKCENETSAKFIPSGLLAEENFAYPSFQSMPRDSNIRN
jgi:hypothetical protein